MEIKTAFSAVPCEIRPYILTCLSPPPPPINRESSRICWEAKPNEVLKYSETSFWGELCIISNILFCLKADGSPFVFSRAALSFHVLNIHV